MLGSIEIVPGSRGRRHRRGDGRIGTEIARSILGPDPVTVTGAGGEAAVAIAGRWGGRDEARSQLQPAPWQRST